MPTPEEQARLDSTKMSFGEHLEELRSALLKSVLVLAVGVAIGLAVGNSVVDYVQTPLRASLEKFYLRQAVRKQLLKLETMKAAGEPVPANLQAAAEAMAAEGLEPYDFYLAPRELAAALRDSLPETARQLEQLAAERQPDGATSAPAEESPPSEASIPASDKPASKPPAEDKPAEEAIAARPFPDRDELIRVPLYRPIEDDERTRLTGLGSGEPFMIYIKAAFVVGFVVASPWVFYFLWSFVAAGLYRHEQRYVRTYLPISLGLFWSGAALAFFVVFDFVLDFLLTYYEQTGTNPGLRLSEWMSLVLLMPLGFGISFQLPLVMLALERAGIFSVEAYLSKWKIAVLVIFVAAMILSPGGDPYSMLLMALPLVGLYYLGILLCRYTPKTAAPAA
jgi:sec-independent protein translocase protein TatC